MSRFAMCPICGHRMSRVKDMWGNWDGETYTCEFCHGVADEDYEEEPEDWNERLSDVDAEDIWLSSGMDEDYDMRDY